MNLSQLIYDSKGGNFKISDLLPLTKVVNIEDVQRYKNEGYAVFFSLTEFKDKFPELNPNNFYFTSSAGISLPVYMDLNKYIYKEIPIFDGCQVFKIDDEMSDSETIKKYISIMEEQYEKKKIVLLVSSAPEGVRLEFLMSMLKDGYIEDEDAYDVFICLYEKSDFGFDRLSADEVKRFFSYQTDDNRNEIEKKVSDFPDKVTIYRGEGDKSASYKQGACSWTLDINVANFFANRYSEKGSKILIAEIDKKDILDYLPDRNEYEVLVFSENIKIIDVIENWGVQDLGEDLCIDMNIFGRFVEFINMLGCTYYDDHDAEHSKRVLFLALLMSYQMDCFDEKDVELLSIACSVHDIGRENNCECREHGLMSFEKYLDENLSDRIPSSFDISNEEIEFLVKYHCMEDSEALEFLDSKCSYDDEHRKRLLKLLYVLKDADALDRVRFGVRGLDMNYLRSDISKKLILIAVQSLHGLNL